MSNTPKKNIDTDTTTTPSTNFIRNIIDADLGANAFVNKRWAGRPASSSEHAQGIPDPAKIRTRFPPEPNGYLHIGHAKSILLNYGLAQDYQGAFHMRFDDTNPEKEDQEYVDSILEAVHWLGARWDSFGTEHLYHASDYFDYMYQAAELLIQQGHAYVDSQTPEEIRLSRGNFNELGKNSPWRDRPAQESLRLFQEMRDGKHPDASLALRAKIDMASPNINMRDPIIYRIRHAHHHRTGDTWCVYPMYTFAHPIEDALESITHSICTLEFEDQRPFYDWLLERLTEAGMFAHPLPHQYEAARLQLTHVVTSKRKLKQLVDEHLVDGWDDPRMPTVLGLRRRGYTPSSLKLFCDRLGVSKSNSWIDYSLLEGALREDLDPVADRAVAVLNPLKLVITNFPKDHVEPCQAPLHPHHPERGLRHFNFGPELWIEQDDFAEDPPKGFFRLTPGGMVRLKYGYIVKCTGCVKNAQGEVTEVHAEYLPETKSGTPGSSSVKVKGVITWINVKEAIPAEIRLYSHLFSAAHPGASGEDEMSQINPNSLTIQQGFLEPSIQAIPDKRWQFERLGYFVADRELSRIDAPVINRITTLKDSYQ